MTAMLFPPPPDVPPEHRATARIPLRYEDVTQDGRLAMEALAPALGEVVWRQLLTGKPNSVALGKQGIVPILSRIVMEGAGGPFSTSKPIDASGLYELAHAVGPTGEVERLVVNMWVEAVLPIGKNFGPRPPRAGEPDVAGRLFGEHVLTRLFAPPDQRKVLKIELPGMPELPGRRLLAVPPASVMVLPDGAVPLEDTLEVDRSLVAFGLAHTDSNQHVNSLVYPRMFEDAAIRRFAKLGRLKPPLLSRFVELAFRKPCFAGERYGVALQTFALGDRFGAIGGFFSEADSAGDVTKARAHCYVRMIFEP